MRIGRRVLQTFQVETAVRNLCAKGYESLTTARDEWDQTVARTKYAKGQAMVAVRAYEANVTAIEATKSIAASSLRILA